MKHILLVALIAISVNGFGQTELPLKEGKVFYESIDSTPLNKAEAFMKAKAWFVNTFNSGKDVLQIDDKDGGIIMGKGYTQKSVGNFMTGPLEQDIYYVINITVKDNKYRIQLYNIYVSIPASSAHGKIDMPAENIIKHPRSNSKFIQRIDESCKDIISRFKAAMLKAIDNNF